MKTAVIIGSKGQDGQFLTRLLKERGYQVIGFHRQGLDGCTPVEDSFDLVGALTDLLEAGTKLDELYFLAAYHHSASDKTVGAVELMQLSYQTNTLLFAAVLECLKSASPATRVFYAGSSHMYGEVFSTGPISEDQPYIPLSPYALSKVAAVQIADAYRRQYGLFITVGVLFNHESHLRGESFLTRKIVDYALALSERGYAEEKLMLARPDAIVDWGYAPDYVEAMLCLMQHSESGVFNIGSGQINTVEDFTREVFGALGLCYEENVETGGVLRTRANIYIADTRKIEAAIGWRYTRPLSELAELLIEGARKRDQKN